MTIIKFDENKRIERDLDEMILRAGMSEDDRETEELASKVIALGERYPNIHDPDTDDEDLLSAIERQAFRMRICMTLHVIAGYITDEQTRSNVFARGMEVFRDVDEPPEELMDRSFTQICEAFNVSPLIVKYVVKEHIPKLEISLNDCTNERLALEILVEEVFGPLCERYLDEHINTIAGGLLIYTVPDPNKGVQGFAEEFIREYELAALLMRAYPVSHHDSHRLVPFLSFEDAEDDETDAFIGPPSAVTVDDEIEALIERYYQRLLQAERSLKRRLDAAGSRPVELDLSF